MKYWKGFYKPNGNRILITVYDRPKKNMFETQSIGEVFFLFDGHSEEITEDADVDILYSIDRIISDEEFLLLTNVAKLSNEVFLNQYTGGFPKEENCAQYANKIRINLPKVLEIQSGRYQ